MSKLKILIHRAIDYTALPGKKGSQARLAEVIGCSQQQIAWMLKTGRVTAEMAILIDKATDGAVKRHELRPDLFDREAAA